MLFRPARAALVVGASLLASCGGSPEPGPRTARREREPKPPAVTATLELPRGDGRVHIVDVPGRYDVAKCLVHVSPTGTSTMTCIPQADIAPLSHEP